MSTRENIRLIARAPFEFLKFRILEILNFHPCKRVWMGGLVFTIH